MQNYIYEMGLERVSVLRADLRGRGADVPDDLLFILCKNNRFLTKIQNESGDVAKC